MSFPDGDSSALWFSIDVNLVDESMAYYQFGGEKRTQNGRESHDCDGSILDAMKRTNGISRRTEMQLYK
jgi:hypothetical protein